MLNPPVTNPTASTIPHDQRVLAPVFAIELEVFLPVLLAELPEGGMVVSCPPGLVAGLVFLPGLEPGFGFVPGLTCESPPGCWEDPGFFFSLIWY